MFIKTVTFLFIKILVVFYIQSIISFLKKTMIYIINNLNNFHKTFTSAIFNVRFNHPNLW